MRHLFRCPMRWADMDLLGHVNNVTYVDYLQEARIDMLAAHGKVSGGSTTGGEALAEGVVVVRHDVVYRAPLVYRREPVSIECWVTDVRAASFTMAYEVFDETNEGRRVYLRARTVLAPYVFAEERPRRLTSQEREALARFREPDEATPERIPTAPPAGARHAYELAVRFSDVDVYGHVNNVTYFEYFQEARICYLLDMHRPEDGEWRQWVVAQTDVEYREPVHFRLEPYAVHSWVTSVGTTSTVLGSEIRDGDRVLARARVVMVAFDRESQSAASLHPGQRARLVAEAEAGQGG